MLPRQRGCAGRTQGQHRAGRDEGSFPAGEGVRPGARPFPSTQSRPHPFSRVCVRLWRVFFSLVGWFLAGPDGMTRHPRSRCLPRHRPTHPGHAGAYSNIEASAKFRSGKAQKTALRLLLEQGIYPVLVPWECGFIQE